MKIIFLGKSPCIPDEPCGDAPCFIVDGKYLVDLGYKSALSIAEHGIDPNSVKHVFVTHCHHDHIMGLPLFLFYKLQTKGTTCTVYGHASQIADTVKRAEDFAMLDRYYLGMPRPKVRELSGGDSLDIDDLHVECFESDHAVPGLCYKFTIGNKSLGILGDSRYKDEIADFFLGCDAIVHEVSQGVGAPVHERFPSGHSCAFDAAKTANRCKTGRMFLVHGGKAQQEAVLSAIAESYSGEVLYPELFREYEI